MRRSRTSAPRLPPSDAGSRSRTGVCCCPPPTELAARAPRRPHPSETMPICTYCYTCLELGTLWWCRVIPVCCLLWVERFMSSLSAYHVGGVAASELCLRVRIRKRLRGGMGAPCRQKFGPEKFGVPTWSCFEKTRPRATVCCTDRRDRLHVQQSALRGPPTDAVAPTTVGRAFVRSSWEPRSLRQVA